LTLNENKKSKNRKNKIHKNQEKQKYSDAFCLWSANVSGGESRSHMM
jgi:hypothetical protein